MNTSTLNSVLSATALLACLSGVANAQATRWEERSPAHHPSSRFSHAMIWDDARGHVLLFGGERLNGNRLSDTWTYDGADWTLVSPAHSPPARAEHAMAYDSIRRRVVLFGGIDSSGVYLRDTWEWDGSDWVERLATTRPSARLGAAMAFDPGSNELLLFGGSTGWLNQVSGTWQWDGTEWTELSPPTRPAARVGHGMAYDGRIVLFGGVDVLDYMRDTWEWDGTNWNQFSPPTRPGEASGHGMAYDASRGRIVVFGGLTASGTRDSCWEWNGVTWRATIEAPAARRETAMAYDRVRDRVVMFGGRRDSAQESDTWEFYLTEPARFDTFGSGCSGTLGTPRLDAAPGNLPWIREPFTIVIDAFPTSPLSVPYVLLGFSNTTMGSIPLPLDLGFVGMPGCPLNVNIAVVFQLVNYGGYTTLTFVVPDDVSLVETYFYVQGFVTDAGANPFGAIVTAGRAARLGMR